MARYRKFITAIVGGAATAALVIWGPDSQAVQIIQVVIVALTSLGVYALPNEPAPVVRTRSGPSPY